MNNRNANNKYLPISALIYFCFFVHSFSFAQYCPLPQGPGGDTPDESADVSTLSNGGEPFTLKAPEVILLKEGFFNNLHTILSVLKIPTVFTDLQSPSSLLHETSRILFLPSGSLAGRENSEFLKTNLHEFVSSGGVLIVFSQQRGYEYSVIPGSPSGYGFREDQSCYLAGSAIDQFHPIVTSQKDSTFDGGIDGFFVEWPKDAKILLRRVKNNFPAAIVYPYGEGFVVATTLYTDFAFTSGQLTQDEVTFLKDLLVWAKNPKQEYPQTQPGETVSLPVSVTNNTSENISAVKFDVKDSSGAVIFTNTVALSVPQGQTVSYTLSFQAPTALGIYSVFYSLLPTALSPLPAVLAENVSVTQGIQSTVLQKELTFSVVSPGDFFLKGSPVTFGILVTNSGATDRIVNLSTWSHSTVTENKGNFFVPAQSTKTIPHTTRDIYFTFQEKPLWDFYIKAIDDLRQVLVDIWQIGAAGTTAIPAVALTAFTGITLLPGQTEPFAFTLTNLTPANTEGALTVSVFSPKNEKLFEGSVPVTLSGQEVRSESLSFTLPSGSGIGLYPVVATFSTGGQLLGSATGYFQVPKPEIQMAAILPPIFSLSAPSPVQMKLQNIGGVFPEGELQVTLKDPQGQTVFEEVRHLVLPHNEVQTEEFQVTLSETTFGTYRLSYTFTATSGDPPVPYPGVSPITGQAPVPNDVASATTQTKGSYTTSETVEATLNLKNTGQMEQKFNVEALYIATNFSQTNALTLQPNETKTIAYTLPLSSAVTAGSQAVGVFLKAVNTLNRPFFFTVLPSKLVLSLPPAAFSLQPGSTGTIEVKNTGGVGTSYNYDLMLQDLKGNIFLNTSGSDSIAHSSTKQISFTVPDTGLATGDYNLLVKVTDTGTGKKTAFEPFGVRGKERVGVKYEKVGRWT